MQEIYDLQKKYEVSFLYEAAVCGSIPIIRNLEEYYNNDFLQSLEGIVNGSTNYVLSKIFYEDLSFPLALKEAQEKGYAESNPILDIGGFDARSKLQILLLAHSFGITTKPEDVFRYRNSEFISVRISLCKRKKSSNKIISLCP
ncbi:hypothetical protein [Halpernia sp. GG3]